VKRLVGFGLAATFVLLPATAMAEPASEPPGDTAPVAPDQPPLPEEEASAPAQDPEPVTAPEPVPAPEPAVAPEVSATTTPETETTTSDAPGKSDGPVARNEPGQWGMSFVFGGLAPLSIAGIQDHAVNRLLFTELGFRRVLQDGWVVPFSVGAGVFHHNPETGGKQNDVGLAATVGILRYFRPWRRIAPHGGGNLHVHYLDPTGDNNWLVTLLATGVVGIEYYVGDRVSLLLQGEAGVGVNILDEIVQVRAATQIAAGGQMGLVFYF
jgi:hypothetical protein